MRSVEALFEALCELWPSEIDLSDDDPEGPLWTLVKIYDAIEDRSQSLADIVDASIWPFHQCLARMAKEKIASGDRVIYPAEVSIEDFRAALRKGLSDPTWAEVEAKYAFLM